MIALFDLASFDGNYALLGRDGDIVRVEPNERQVYLVPVITSALDVVWWVIVLFSSQRLVSSSRSNRRSKPNARAASDHLAASSLGNGGVVWIVCMIIRPLDDEEVATRVDVKDH